MLNLNNSNKHGISQVAMTPSLKKHRSKTGNAELSIFTKCLTRYSNIIPYDYNRVRLGTNGDGPYINASYVESRNGKILKKSENV